MKLRRKAHTDKAGFSESYERQTHTKLSNPKYFDDVSVVYWGTTGGDYRSSDFAVDIEWGDVVEMIDLFATKGKHPQALEALISIRLDELRREETEEAANTNLDYLRQKLAYWQEELDKAPDDRWYPEKVKEYETRIDNSLSLYGVTSD